MGGGLAIGAWYGDVEASCALECVLRVATFVEIGSVGPCTDATG